jgi:hypothetical protein
VVVCEANARASSAVARTTSVSQWYTHRFVHITAPRHVEALVSRKYTHALIVVALTALFVWLFARFFVRHLYLAESDLYENGLPIFLSPIWKWSSFEFIGLPVLADPANFNFYLPNVLFGEILRSWTAVVMSGPLLAACFMYAYAFSVTRSPTAAVFSALAYGLSEEMLERLRHVNHVHVIAWLPLIVLALDRLRGPHTLRWVAIGPSPLAVASLPVILSPRCTSCTALGSMPSPVLSSNAELRTSHHCVQWQRQPPCSRSASCSPR